MSSAASELRAAREEVARAGADPRVLRDDDLVAARAAAEEPDAELLRAIEQILGSL